MQADISLRTALPGNAVPSSQTNRGNTLQPAWDECEDNHSMRAEFFLHQRSLTRHANYQNADIEIIPDITVFTQEINYDWRRRNFTNTLKETLYSLEVKASERHRGRLQQKEIETDIQKLVAQREETERIHNRRIGVGMFIIDVAPDTRERMKVVTLNYLSELARQQDVDLWYLNQETQVEAVVKAAKITG